MGGRGKKLRESWDQFAATTEDQGAQTQAAIDAANKAYIDSANAAQEQLNQQMQAVREAEANRWANYAGGMEALIGEREKEIARAREVANAEYMASQNAAKATGLTNLASSIANLISVGGFNASNQTYQNPSLDWMKKADQDRLINRQRMDNLRERQRALQQQMLDIKNQGAGQLIGLDRELAGQGYQHGMNIAGAQRDNAVNSAKLGLDIATQAGQARLQGVGAEAQADLQDAQMAQQERHFNAQMEERRKDREAQEKHYRDQNAVTLARYGLQQDENGNITPILDTNGQPVKVTGSSRSSGSGGGSSTSGNNYEVTVDGQKIVLGMNTETFKTAILRGKNELKQDVMAEAGFDGTWDEFLDAISAKKVKNPEGRGRIENPLFKYNEIADALDSNDEETAGPIIEDYVHRHKGTANNFNRSLLNLANRGSLIGEAEQVETPQPPASPAAEEQAGNANAAGYKDPASFMEYLRNKKN